MTNTIKNSFTFRDTLADTLHFDRSWDTSISRADFEQLFTKTNETVEFTFQGWDGKSYDGESRKAKVLHTSLSGWEEFRFIKVGKHVHMVDEDGWAEEKATGLKHHTVGWVTDVDRA